MQLPFATKKSSGVRVANATHAAIKAADAARNSGDWAAAGAGYAMALEREPKLAHIWVQLGHAENRQHRPDRAEAAYLKAAALQPDDPDPLIHLGHLRKDAGDLFGAARYYLDATRRDFGALDAAGELQRLIARVLPANRPDLRTMLGAQLITAGQKTERPDIWIDLSDLIASVVEAQALSSVARATADTRLALLGQSGVGACAHVEGHSGWLRLHPEQAKSLLAPRAGTDSTGLDRQKQAALAQLELIFAPPLAFQPGDRLIGLGATADIPDHSLFVAGARTQGALFLAPAGVTPAPDVALAAEGGPALLAEARASGGAAPVAADTPPCPLAALVGMGAGQWGLALRTGTGWLRPGDWGSWTHPAGAEIRMAVPDSTEPLRLTLLLRGLPTRTSGFQLFVDDGTVIEGKLAPDERKWVSTDLLPLPDGKVRLMLKGREAEAIRERPEAPLMSVAVGLIGLHLCRKSDQAERRAFLEALTFGNLDWL